LEGLQKSRVGGEGVSGNLREHVEKVQRTGMKNTKIMEDAYKTCLPFSRGG
jgi:hypothetical protein